MARALLVLCVALACSCAGTDAPAPAVQTESHARRGPASRRELPTTSGAIYVRNLEAELAAAERAAAEPSADAADFRTLGSIRYRAGRYHGDIDRIASAGDAFDAAIARDPAAGDLYALRAKVHGTLHRFAAARADAERAESLGAPPTRTVAMGHVEAAQLELARGDTAAAELAFEAAEDAIADPDPMFVAWLYTQRGAALMDSDPHRAVEFLAAAVDRLPGFVLAEEHLAEALHLVGRDDDAIEIYERVIARTNDPSFMGALAQILAQHGRQAEADAWLTRGHARFAVLLERYPEAMSGHASEFRRGAP